MSDNRFLDRLRADAAPLRYQPDDPALWSRLAARVRERINQPTVADLIVSWLRPLAASLAALAMAALIGLAALDNDESFTLAEPIEISMAGESYSVGD